MADPVSLEEQITTVRRLVTRMEGRELYLRDHRQTASIHVNKEDLDGLRAVLATLVEVERRTLTEYQKTWPRLFRNISFLRLS
jgi:hypothetical protein